MHISKMLAAAFAVALLAAPAYAFGQCPSGMSMCGTPGKGGHCYRPGYATCYGDIACSTGMSACQPGKYGKGGCYRPTYTTCTAGMICQAGMSVCPPGPNGKGGCYKPVYRKCEGGRIR